MPASSARPLWACTMSCLLIFGVVVRPAWSQERIPGSAGSSEPAGDLTLAGAVEAALAHNPDLAASAYDIRVAQARVLQAGLRPNPALTAEFENMAGSGAFRGIDALESTLSLSQVIELGDKRARRSEAAAADRDLAAVEQRARQLDVLAEVTRRFVALLVAQERRALIGSTVELAHKTLEAISVRVQAARSPEAERSRARIVLMRAQLDLRQAETDLRSARHALAAMWGSTEPRFREAHAALFTLEEVRSFESLVDSLERSPDFLRFASVARLREAELRLARAQARPDLSLSAGVRRLQDSGDHALVAGFSMPLAIFNRNQGGVREAEVQQARNGAERAAAFVRARATLFALYQTLGTARARLETLVTEAVPQAEAALAQTQYGYERGRFSFLELATAQQDLLALREAAIAAAADYHDAQTEIERLTSESLSQHQPERDAP